MKKRLQDLDLKDDFLFAKVMSDLEICRIVLEKILDISIQKVKIPENQKAIDLLLDAKAVRLDIYVNDENGTVYNVEMQKTDHKNLGKRSRYYQGNIDLDLISKGENYRELKKSFVIFICCFDPYGEGRHKYTFKNMCCENKGIVLDDDVTKVFLSTKGKLQDVSEELQEFLDYVEHSTEEYARNARGTLVKQVHEKVDEVKHDKRLEVEFMTLLERDKEKIEEGREEGREEERRKMVKKLLALGMDVNQISEITELGIQQIEAIKTEM